jgi:hypothetical protein
VVVLNRTRQHPTVTMDVLSHKSSLILERYVAANKRWVLLQDAIGTVRMTTNSWLLQEVYASNVGLYRVHNDPEKYPQLRHANYSIN